MLVGIAVVAGGGGVIVVAACVGVVAPVLVAVAGACEAVVANTRAAVIGSWAYCVLSACVIACTGCAAGVG